MANEVLYAGLADQRLTEVLSTEYLLLLADRAALPNHPALVYLGDLAGTGSVTKKLAEIGMMGYDLPVQTADGADVANTAFADASATVTIARMSKAYEASDLARLTDSLGVLNPQVFAADAVVSAAVKLMDLTANLVDGFTATVGTTGVDHDVAVHLAGVTALEIANCPGPYMALYHGRQYGDLRDDLALAVGGGVQYAAATQEQLQVRGGSYKGAFLGCDIFVSNRVPTANAGADRAGAIWGRGGVVWADASIPSENDPNQLIIGGKVLLERVRNGRGALTAYVMHNYLGVGFGINAAGVTVISDA